MPRHHIDRRAAEIAEYAAGNPDDMLDTRGWPRSSASASAGASRGGREASGHPLSLLTDAAACWSGLRSAPSPRCSATGADDGDEARERRGPRYHV